jgi:hypothetical protein
MRPVKDLRRLAGPVIRRMRRLDAIIYSQSKVLTSDRDSRGLAYSIIELQNTWVEFVKNYFFHVLSKHEFRVLVM